MFIAAGLPIGLVLRKTPEECGLLLDGGPATPRRNDALGVRLVLTNSLPKSEISFSTAEALRDRFFWLLAGATSLCAIAQSALIVHAIPFLNGVGLEPTLAASVVAAMSVISVAGRILFGYVGDRFPKRGVLAVAFGLQACGVVWWTPLSRQFEGLC